jgi:hypothetical protein
VEYLEMAAEMYRGRLGWGRCDIKWNWVLGGLFGLLNEFTHEDRESIDGLRILCAWDDHSDFLHKVKP